jgi:hypothetical protein
MYCNETAYNPDAISGLALEGGWNTDIVAGINLLSAAFSNVRTSSAHVTFQITGVSNLNKQGTIHMAETVETGYYSGTAADTTYGESAVERCAVSRLPKFEKYKSIEIVNMGPDSVLEYHYMPLTNRDLLTSYVDLAAVTTSSNTDFVNELGKVFNLTIRGAAAGTTIRAKYEITFECDVLTDYINDYPPQYSRCFVDSEPTLCLLNQNADYVIRSNIKQGHLERSLYKEVNAMNLISQADPLLSTKPPRFTALDPNVGIKLS